MTKSPGSTIRESTSRTGVQEPTWNTNSAISCGANPYCGTPGTTGDPIERVAFDQKVKVASHEIGHAIGLMHPADPNSENLAGTAVATGPDAKNYPSVMWNGCFGGNVTKDLSTDDVACANVIALVP